ncbi:MAG: polyphosphate kinase 1 [Acidobacteriota bacterium]
MTDVAEPLPNRPLDATADVSSPSLKTPAAPAGATTSRIPPEPSLKSISLDSQDLFFNRELSWLRFNERVLEEAYDISNPLLERVRFLSIFHTNLDEFYMIRVSGLRRQLASGVLEAPPDGMTPVEQMQALRSEITPLLQRAVDLWHEDLLPRLRHEGIHLLSYDELTEDQRAWLRDHFKREIFPVLTPLAFDPGHPFPHISNLSLSLAVAVRDPNAPHQTERFARVKVPATFPRLLAIADQSDATRSDELGLPEQRPQQSFIWLEEVVAHNLDLLFPGLTIAAAYPFRVTRDADLEIEADEASDLLEALEEVVEQRQFGFVVHLEVDERMPPWVRDILLENLELAPYQLTSSRGPVGLADVSAFTDVERPDLKFRPFVHHSHPAPKEEGQIFSLLRQRDHLLYLPYDSFQPVVTFLQQAARDPKVLAIKQTLYRVGPNSPIVQALMRARENGKQVAVLVELKARFDEENNMVWARELEQKGVHVVYGDTELKTHAKICLVVRRESVGIRRYLHLSTGNYNPVTARIYTDLGFFTCDEALANDLSDLFNRLTGYSAKRDYSKIIAAPHAIREALLERIHREIEHQQAGRRGHIALKMNSLVDKRCIQALYRASAAGVQVQLQVRGICCLRPGLPGLSENIEVTSIVGRFLEHTRIYYFRNGGDEEILTGSADLMPRNLDGRVEVLFPIEDPELKKSLRDDILFLHLRDTSKARRMLSDGSYERRRPAAGEEPLNTQEYLLQHGGSWRRDED